MLITITGKTEIILTLADGPLDIALESDDPDAGFGPLHMLAASLATCTGSVLESYAETARLQSDGTRIRVTWEYAEQPHRVGAYELEIIWPHEIPEARRKALLRAAEQCTVHATLTHSPAISARVAE